MDSNLELLEDKSAADIYHFDNRNLGKNTRDIMSETKFYEGYSRWDETKGRYETWDEAVERVMNMHREFYADKLKANPELEDLFKEAEDCYKQKYVVGSQRALQFGGAQLLKHQFRMYNCVATYADREEVFGEIFYVLLCGAGAGFSVQKHHVKKLQKIKKRTKKARTFVVPDSIEGWAKSLDVLLSSYFEEGGKHAKYAGHRIYFDTSKIRPKGAFISGGFKAPGPEPLEAALKKIEHLLNEIITSGRTRLKPIHVYDILMHAADAVLAGGVRRSATICIFSPDDKDMLSAKTGNWYETNPQRARSNNSALLVRDKTTKEDFHSLFESVKQYGEPGFIFASSTEQLFNPCVTKDTWIATSKGLKQVEQLIDNDWKKGDKLSVNYLVNGKKVKGSPFVKTGYKPVYKLTTTDGYELKLTKNHKILVEVGRKQDPNGGYKVQYEWIEAGDLEEGDKIVLHNHRELYNNKKHNLNESEGYALGIFVGDGTFSYNKAVIRLHDNKQECANKISSYLNSEGIKEDFIYNEQAAVANQNWTTSSDNRILGLNSEYLTELAESYDIIEDNKTLTDKLMKSGNSTLRGFIAGLFDADGSVQGSADKGYSARITSIDLQMLKNVQIALLKFGINSKIYENRRNAGVHQLPDGKGGSKGYNCQDVHELILGKDNVLQFYKIFDIQNPTHIEKFEDLANSYGKRGPYKERFLTTFESLEYIGREEVYDACVPGPHAFNANGLYVHNCVEIGMYGYFGDKSGFSACNLVDINGGKCRTKAEFIKACRSAAILGTIQAGYTDFKFVSEATRNIIEREALLGCSVTGWMNNPEVLFNEDTLKEGAQLILDINEQVAELIDINPTARATCTKPSGNTSVLLQTTSGIHAEHSPRYIRNMQLNKESEVAQLLKEVNPYMVEESVWSASNSDYVVSFPVVAPQNSIYRQQTYGIGLLEKVKLVQSSWIEAGTRLENCVDKTVRHNVSNTVSVPADKWDEVEDYIYENKEYFAGISLLGTFGDKDYNQAPNTEVLTPKEIHDQYGVASFFASGLIVDAYKGFKDLWEATSTAMYGDASSGQELSDIRANWIRRFNKFAENYFDGDTKKTEYCLKDVYLLHRWEKIQQNLKPVDFTKLQSKKYTDIDTLGAIACQGGACEI